MLTSISYLSTPYNTYPSAQDGVYGETATLSQALTGVFGGKVYFLTVQVSLSGMVNQGDCDILFKAGDQVLVSYNYGANAQDGLVRASGIFNTEPSRLDLSVVCSDFTGSPNDLWASFDKVQLSVYDPSIGTNPIQPVASEGVVNNNFYSGQMTPWVHYTTKPGHMDFSVIDGRAVITYGGIVAGFASPAWISQVLDKPAEAGQRVRVRADVHINIPTAGTGTTMAHLTELTSKFSKAERS